MLVSAGNQSFGADHKTRNVETRNEETRSEDTRNEETRNEETRSEETRRVTAKRNEERRDPIQKFTENFEKVGEIFYHYFNSYCMPQVSQAENSMPWPNFFYFYRFR